MRNIRVLSEHGYTQEELAKCFVCHTRHKTPQISCARRCASCGDSYMFKLSNAGSYQNYRKIECKGSKVERKEYLESLGGIDD